MRSRGVAEVLRASSETSRHPRSTGALRLGIGAPVGAASFRFFGAEDLRFSSSGRVESILSEEEDAIDWLEAQLHQLADMGRENYLAQQLEE